MLTNHADAWGITFIILSLYLFVHSAVTSSNVALAIAITLAYWLGFALNDAFDAEDDARDPAKLRRNYFIGRARPRLHALSAVFVLLLVYMVGFASRGWVGFMLYTVSISVMWAYSARPLRLKSRPGWDLAIHALFVQTWPYLLAILLIDSPWNQTDTVLLAFFFCSSLAAQLEQQVRDYESDRHTARTFAIIIGRRRSTRLLRAVTSLLLLVGLYGVLSGAFPRWFWPLLALGLPPVLHRFWRAEDTARPERMIRLAVIGGLVYVVGLWLVMLQTLI